MIAKMLAALIDSRDEISSVVDVGAGSGRVLQELSVIRPDLQLLGIDLRQRPKTWLAGRLGPGPLGRAVRMLDQRRGSRCVGQTRAGHDHLCEWLDDLPCRVAARHADGWREVIISDGGMEQAGPRLSSEQLAGPSGGGRAATVPRSVSPGTGRVELVKMIIKRGGCALVIDYGHVAAHRPTTGSLAAYRDGRAWSRFRAR